MEVKLHSLLNITQCSEYLDNADKEYNAIDSHKETLKKYDYFNEIYANVLKLEALGLIKSQEDKKPLKYLNELGKNDGPEFAYMIEFWPIGTNRRYAIGICIRGIPLFKKIK